VDAYRKIHYKEDADDVCNTLRVTYPGDLQVQRSCGMTHTATAQHP
jgi:hypothetical protein